MNAAERELVEQVRTALPEPHYYCEDSWYSCPLAPEGCSNHDIPEDQCQCNATERELERAERVARAIEAAARCEPCAGFGGFWSGRETDRRAACTRCETSGIDPSRVAAAVAALEAKP